MADESVVPETKGSGYHINKITPGPQLWVRHVKLSNKRLRPTDWSAEILREN